MTTDSEVVTLDVPQKRPVLTIRISPELHEQLRVYKFLTQRPINEMVQDAITAYLDGPGRDEMVAGATTSAAAEYRIALDKLQDL
jgi:hypothetical protein